MRWNFWSFISCKRFIATSWEVHCPFKSSDLDQARLVEMTCTQLPTSRVCMQEVLVLIRHELRLLMHAREVSLSHVQLSPACRK